MTPRHTKLDATSCVHVTCTSMPKADPLFLEVASQLRELARNSGVTWSFGSYINPETGLTHFEDELDVVSNEAGVNLNDALYVCKTGKITKGETDIDPPQYRVEGSTTDGIQIGLGVSFNTEEKWIELITIFVVR